VAAAAQAANEERTRGSLLAPLPPRARSMIALMQVKACTALLAALSRIEAASARGINWPVVGSRRATTVLAGVVLSLAVMFIGGQAASAPLDGRSRLVAALATVTREIPRPLSIRMHMRMLPL